MRTSRIAFALVLLVGCGDDETGLGGSGGEAATRGSTASATTRASSASPSSSTGSLPSCDAITCGGSEFCHAGVCRSCDAPKGTQHDLVLPLGDGMEDRAYFLHVPDGYDCSPAPLLVDFHGTSTVSERPEESYQNDALVALADAKNAIVVRPRSRSSMEGGQQVFRWDQNPGDPARNVVFTQNLVEKLRATYNLDPARLYASGFSSGSSMTAQFFGEARGLFSGLAPIAGGIFPSGIDTIDTFAVDAPRVYLATGYRDYLFPTVRTLLDALDDARFPGEAILFRESDTGHDLYPWHFEELWAWLDEGTRPMTGAPVAPWQVEATPTQESLVASASGGAGKIYAATSTGQVILRDASGAWSAFGQVGDGDAGVTGLCASETGRLFAVGEGAFTRSDTLGVFEPPRTVPEFDGAFFGYAYLNGVTCADDDVFVGGYWSSARSADAGATFAQLSMLYAGGIPAQASAVGITEAGTRIGVGYYDYLGRAPVSATEYDEIAHPPGSEWLNDVTSVGTHVFVVGDHGTILHSGDDGVTFEEQASPTLEDLYAVGFFDADHGVAAGRRGTVVVTSDGGVTWTLLPTGVDVFFGAAHRLDAGTVLVLGEGGRTFRATIP